MRKQAPSLLKFAVLCIVIGIPIAVAALLLRFLGLPWWCLLPSAWLLWIWLSVGVLMKVNRRCLTCEARRKLSSLSQAELRFIMVTVLSFSLCACQTMVPQTEITERRATPIAKIAVHSIPTRCVVELNDEYLGMTPLEVVVDATESGNWASQGFGSVFVMRCSTPGGNGWEQKVWYPGNPVPKRVLFRIPGATQGLVVN